MSQVLIAQIGARRHYAVPRALHRAGLLEALVTDACADIAPWRWLGMVLPESRRRNGVRRLMDRSVPELPGEFVKGLPLFSLGSYPGPRRGERRTDYWARRNAAFCRAVVRRGFGGADTVYAFNGAALEIFREAKRLGLRTILDQTAAPWRWNARLLREEIARWPGWEDRPEELDESGALSEREEGEWELADAIVCGSDFCREKIVQSGVRADKCKVIHFDTPSKWVRAIDRTALRKKSQPFCVLFVGTLQLRKGIQYLYEALYRAQFSSLNVRLVGPSLLSVPALSGLSEVADVVGSVPRQSVSTHYEWADLFVLPTLSEGSANVCKEAMAAGLPVISTAAAGSPVRHDLDGLIVKERESEELQDAIHELFEDSDRRLAMGKSAQERVLAESGDDVSTQLARLTSEIGSR